MIGVYARLVKRIRTTIGTANIDGAPAIVIWNSDTIAHVIMLDVADDRIISIRVMATPATPRYLERGTSTIPSLALA